MNMYLDLLILTCITCFVVDVSGFMDSLKYGVWVVFFKSQGRWEDINLKPLTCSLCLSLWSGIVYMLITHSFTILGVGYQAGLSMMTPVITGILLWLREVLNWILVKITPK